MPSRTIGDQRWEQTTENSAGDSMYERTYAGSSDASDYSELTKDKLSAELEARGLPKSGNKDELIARLQEDDG